MNVETCCSNPGLAKPAGCFLCKGAICDNCSVIMEGKEICVPCFTQAQIELHNEDARTSHLVYGLIGGLIVAISTAVLWAYIVMKFDRINGIFALGVGLLTGYGVHLCAGKRRSFKLQLVAVLCAAFAILLGHLLTSVGLIGLAAQKQMGDEFTWLNPVLYTSSIEYSINSFGFFYVLMLAIACYFAWSQNKPRRN